MAKWKTYRHSSLYAWHHSNSRCNGVESVERIEKAQVGSEKFRLVNVDETYHQKDGFCRASGSFGVPFKQQDTHYKPPSFFHMVFTSKTLTPRAGGSSRNETEMECSMRLMLLGEINPDPHARVVGFRATWHNAGVWKAGFNVYKPILTNRYSYQCSIRTKNCI